MLTVDKVAKCLAVSENTVHNLIRGGELVAVKVGRQFRVEPQELERFITANRTGKGAA